MTTATAKQDAPAAVYLVADNLDAVLAAGEDLLRVPLAGGGLATVTEIANSIRVFEMTIAARCLQARARALDLRSVDQRYKALIDLFTSGTRPLVDAIDALGDSTSADFQSGCCPVSYLRARQMIASDAIEIAAPLRVTDNFLVAERIQLGSLLDLCATFLDRLEDHYDLYEEKSVDGDEVSADNLADQPITAAA